MANRLGQETSPYLLQHKDNPVDWYPWGDEAFEKARREDKPVLLSVGYAACHWCHVMERESFEDPETARLMNELFVNIKVDREERPDVDSIYMEAVQAMSGHGGWPMTVFLTPDKEPFYGGTYYPPEDRHGMPGFSKLLGAVDEAWRERRDDIREQGRRLVDHIGIGAKIQPAAGPLSTEVLDEAYRQLEGAFDPVHGGFGGAPKFPQPMIVDLLMRLSLHDHPRAEEMAVRTLDAMASGGMFDQLGGGFARYSVDGAWIVPHFEKMLYDNAQLLRSYGRSWLATGSARHREVAEATAGWMLSEMRDPSGGFWSSLDADSEGHEGAYYLWDLEEVEEVCGRDADVAVKAFGFTKRGNFEGKNIPVYGGDAGDSSAVERVRSALLERRSQRVRPATDTKVLTGWNALAASALAEVGAAMGHAHWVGAARETMEFVLETLRVDGRLMRSYRRTEDDRDDVRALGCCEDYAFVLEACLALYEATFDLEWLRAARWAADAAIELFLDDNNGGFFTTGKDSTDLVIRPKDLLDNAIPSGNSVMALELQRLAILTGEPGYEDHALGALRAAGDLLGRSPTGFGHALQAVDFYAADVAEVVVLGEPDKPDASELLGALRSRFLPNKIVILARPTEEDVGAIPLLEARHRIDGRATAYVCHRGVCEAPTTEAGEMLAQVG